MKSQKSFKEEKKGKLYLVPTPIGNLEDMTFRAVRILNKVDLIACEDTRTTQNLLNHFEITTKKTSYHDHNIQEKTDYLINQLSNGKNIAQVSDAGMPSISDPGVELVKAAIDADVSVIPLPGANAATTALIASGIDPQPFVFYGFLNRKKSALVQDFEMLKNKKETLIFYESPHRLKRFLKELINVLGGERQITLAREVTKRYEEFIRGTAEELYKWAESTQLKGEFVVIVEGNTEPTEKHYWHKWTILEHIDYLMTFEKLSNKEAIKKVAEERKIPKRKVYATYHQK